jgi:hypothetical protein
VLSLQLQRPFVLSIVGYREASLRVALAAVISLRCLSRVRPRDVHAGPSTCVVRSSHDSHAPRALPDPTWHFAPGGISDGPCGPLPGRHVCLLADPSGGGARAQPPRRYRPRQRSWPPVWAQSHSGIRSSLECRVPPPRRHDCCRCHRCPQPVRRERPPLEVTRRGRRPDPQGGRRMTDFFTRNVGHHPPIPPRYIDLCPRFV